MIGYLVRRLVLLGPVLIGLSAIVFAIFTLIPGDPATVILGAYAAPERLAALRADLGLDQPPVLRYVSWLADVVSGELGQSFALRRPVADEIADRLPATVILAAAALALGTLAGVAAGVTAAVNQNGWPDRLVTLVVLVGLSTPSFFLGIVLILGLSVSLGWFPTGGMYDLFGDRGLVDLAHHLVLPAVTLATVAAAVIARFARAAMLEVLRQDSVRTARAMGLSEARVIGRHALNNALVQVIPIIALQAGFVIGGTVYVESVFQWPGLGRMLVDAIAARDVPLVQGGVLVLAAGYVGINLAADLVQMLVDPRLRPAS